MAQHKAHLAPPLLPIQGLRARNIIHAKIEENIRAKMARKEPEGGYKDALQLLMEHTQGNGEQLNMQVRFPGTRSIPFPPACLPSQQHAYLVGLEGESRRYCPFLGNKPACAVHWGPLGGGCSQAVGWGVQDQGHAYSEHPPP